MSARTFRNVSGGSLAGVLAGAWASAGLSVAMGKPVTGCACITIALAFGLLGALVGAAVEEF